MFGVIDLLYLFKTWFLIHGAFFLFLLRISIKNVDKRLNAIERRMECE